MIQTQLISVADAYNQLLGLRSDLKLLPANLLGQRMSDSLFDLCMKARNEAARSLNLPEERWHEIFAGKLLLQSSTYTDALVAVGSWIGEFERREPGCNPTTEPVRPFGFNQN